MSKRAGILIATVAVISAVTGTWLAWNREPVYQGKSLTAWLEEIDYQQSPRDEKSSNAIEAVRQIGTDALPRLLKMLQARDSVFKLTAMKFLNRQKLLKIRIHGADHWKRRARRGLWALGPKAEPAIPILEQQFFSGNDDQGSAAVLAAIGPAALPVFEKAMTNGNSQVRQGVLAFWVATNYLHDAAPIIARMVKNDPDYGLRSWAAIVLAKTGQYEELVVPALLLGMKYPENDTRADSARALLHYPAKARDNLDAIRALANDSDPIVRYGAKDALSVLDPEAAKKIE